jgi:hypothetical protein
MLSAREMVIAMKRSLGKSDGIQKDWSAQATAGLRSNLCEFPAMFAKSVQIGTADECHTATATLLDFGNGPLAITCEHVIAGFVERWRAGRALIRVGNVRVSASQLAALDKDIDLAIIRLSDEQAADLVSEGGLATQFYRPSRWPPDPARQGEYVAVGGFPAQWRQKRSESREMILPYYGIGATPVSSVSERAFGCAFERDQWIWMSRNTGLTDLTSMGGLSGGPVFAERHLHRALVGIVSEFQEGLDIMFMSHSHWISADGSIRADRPWG